MRTPVSVYTAVFSYFTLHPSVHVIAFSLFLFRRLSMVHVFALSLFLSRRLSSSCCYTYQILDIDLDVWRRRGGDLTAGAETVGNNKPGVGVEERNFSQKDDSASHLAALRVQVTWAYVAVDRQAYGQVLLLALRPRPLSGFQRLCSLLI